MLRLNILVGIIILSLSIQAISADIQYVPNRTVNKRASDRKHIEITGEITQGDQERLIEALLKLEGDIGAGPVYPQVFLDSPGGNVEVALQMGRILRDKLAGTNVDVNATCSSSCIFLLASGVQRNVWEGGQLGLHRPRFDYEYFGGMSKDNARGAYQAMVNMCQDYMREMAIDDKILSDMLNTPSNKIMVVGREYAVTYKLDGEDPAWQEWKRAKEIKKYGEKEQLAWEKYLECVGSGKDSRTVCDERYELDRTK